MNFETLNVTTDSRGVMTVMLDREDKHNVMDERMLLELTDLAGQLAENNEVRAVVITGRGKSFCAGADLNWMKANLKLPVDQRLVESAKLATMLKKWNELPQLVIARVNGQAFGGGVGIICICDITIGVDTARFSLSEVKLGIAPANISPYVLQRVGRKNARRLLLNAHMMTAHEAQRFELLDECVEMPELDAAVEREINELMQCGPVAVAATKKLIDFVSTHSPEEAQKYGTELLAELWEGQESKEGITAFFERRKPAWFARD